MDFPMAARTAFQLLKFASLMYVTSEYFVDVTQCIGPSMKPTFEGYGDVVIVDKRRWITYRYNRGDVILAASPTDPSKTVCKRILAIAGDDININDLNLSPDIPKFFRDIEEYQRIQRFSVDLNSSPTDIFEQAKENEKVLQSVLEEQNEKDESDMLELEYFFEKSVIDKFKDDSGSEEDLNELLKKIRKAERLKKKRTGAEEARRRRRRTLSKAKNTNQLKIPQGYIWIQGDNPKKFN